MTRREAIRLFLRYSRAIEHEFGSPGSEREDTRAALRALGVTEAEIDEAEKG